MANKELEYNNLSIDEMVAKLKEKRSEIIEAFAKAYLADTGMRPTEVELVCQEMPMTENKIIEHVYYFRRKQT